MAYGFIRNEPGIHSFIHRSEKINTRKVLRYEFVVTCFIVLCVACINICICTEFRLELNKKRNNNAVEVKIYVATSPPPPLLPSLDIVHLYGWREGELYNDHNVQLNRNVRLIEAFWWWYGRCHSHVRLIHSARVCVCLSEWIWNLLVRFASHKLLTVSI